MTREMIERLVVEMVEAQVKKLVAEEFDRRKDEVAEALAEEARAAAVGAGNGN